MKKHLDRKLSLNRETLAPLTPDTLDAIHGGASLTLTPPLTPTLTPTLTPPLTTLVSRLTNCNTGGK